MAVNKIVTKVDGTINKAIDFNDLKAGLAVGSHTITVEAWNGSTLVSAQTRNITIASSDSTAPTITTATVEDANPNKLVVVFSEVVTITNTTGLTITGAATPTLSAPTGSGSNTITFTLSTALTNGQSVTLNVTSSNTIKDAASNSLAATTKAITNNVAAAGSYDADYQAVLDYATANGIALPTTTQQDLDNQFIIDYKASGGWALDDTVFQFKSTATTAFKLICWKRRIQAVAYGGLTWSDSGVLGNGTNGYIDPLFIPSTDAVNFTLEDASIGFSIFSESAVSPSFIAGAYDGTLSSYILLSVNNGSSSYAVINGDVQTSPAYSKLGYTSVNRISDKIWIDNTTEMVRTIGQVIGVKLYILARNKQGVADSFNNTGIGFLSVGASKKTIHSSIAPLF